MLPDSSQLPAWVRWIAQDADGTWWGYEHEPNIAASGWYENEAGRSVCLKNDRPNPLWKETIQKI